MSDYKPLSDYGIIGNLETCALVGRDGAIDWCCLPRLNSSSVFAALLDDEIGGRFAIYPTDEYEAEQQYMERTNVLQTTFHTESGTARVTDFMPLSPDNEGNQPKVRGIYRNVSCTEGDVDLAVEFDPRFDYARADSRVESISDGVVASGDARRLTLSSPLDLDCSDSAADGTLSLSEYDNEWFVLEYGTRAPTDDDSCEHLLDNTVEFWRDWAHTCPDGEDCPFADYGHDMVVRSDLTLKLLTYQGTGGITAAPTTSLPEVVGGVRNWDYRYNWIRDGAFTVRAFGNLGDTQEAVNYLDDFLELGQSVDPADLQPIYGLQHGSTYEEQELDHLEGYRNSAPVRIGNGAADQLQLGIYGELVLAINQLSWSDRSIAGDDWEAVREIVDYVCEVWERPDAGIWEMRSGPKQFVHSKAMCWVAVDRGIRMAENDGHDAPLDEWRDERSRIKETVLERGFDDDQNSFTQAFDDDQLDASLLLLPLSGFLPFDDPRIQGTIESVIDRLATDDGLVYRYEHDEMPGDEGTFVLCSFWLVDCLARMGRVDRAREIFETIEDHFSPLGLVSEEIDPETGDLLGNYPQAFSHIGFVNSALFLHEAETDTEIQPFGHRSV
ncbi:glycoside hydrolase family 15 protein [Halococcus thailandensis]|uniref:Glycoside hydrolase 15-like protein n=1 Tax=Halococcus thailandensis JCM 13552 TaxID=1227457 RepID=M0MYJ2_9EURY|nr:glycoside hydrolase family 15 protein [Halococcus thailandensis]EMA49470.1 glycoside hydrolase 15-like protein [Halococcus thailandensis JCM 13552]